MTAHLPIRPFAAPQEDPGVAALALAGAQDALDAFLVIVQAQTRADHVCLISEIAPGKVRIIRATSSGVEGLCFKTPATLTGAPKRLADLAKTFGWAGALPTSLSTMHSLLTVPFAGSDGRAGALLCLAKRIQAFSPRHGAHLAQLTARAHRTLQSTGASSRLGMGVVDLRGPEASLLQANAGLAQMLGQDTASLAGSSLRSLMANATPGAERLTTANALRDGLELQCQLRNRAAPGPLVTLTLVPMPGPSLLPEVAVLLVDDRARRGAEPGAGQLETTLNGARDAIVLLDAFGRIIFANPATESLLPAGDLSWIKGALFSEIWLAALSRMGAELPRKALRRPPLARICAYPAGITITLPDARRLLVHATPLAQGGLLLLATAGR